MSIYIYIYVNLLSTMSGLESIYWQELTKSMTFYVKPNQINLKAFLKGAVRLV